MNIEDANSVARQVLACSNAYDVLNLDRSSACDFALVKQNFKRLVLLLHPDKCGGNNALTLEAFNKVKQSFEQIKSSEEPGQPIVVQNRWSSFVGRGGDAVRDSNCDAMPASSAGFRTAGPAVDQPSGSVAGKWGRTSLAAQDILKNPPPNVPVADFKVAEHNESLGTRDKPAAKRRRRQQPHAGAQSLDIPTANNDACQKPYSVNVPSFYGTFEAAYAATERHTVTDDQNGTCMQGNGLPDQPSRWGNTAKHGLEHLLRNPLPAAVPERPHKARKTQRTKRAVGKRRKVKQKQAPKMKQRQRQIITCSSSSNDDEEKENDQAEENVAINLVSTSSKSSSQQSMGNTDDDGGDGSESSSGWISSSPSFADFPSEAMSSRRHAARKPPATANQIAAAASPVQTLEAPGRRQHKVTVQRPRKATRSSRNISVQSKLVVVPVKSQ